MDHMKPGLLLLIAFLVIPMAEVATFIAVGGVIGLVWTLAGIVLTAIAGSILVRAQGLQLIRKIRTEMNANRLPGRELAHGVMVLGAGLLLLTPGFVTDALGFLLLVPPLRDIIHGQVKSRMTVAMASGQFTAGVHGQPFPGSGIGPGPRREDEVVDLDPGEYRHETPKQGDQSESG